MMWTVIFAAPAFLLGPPDGYKLVIMNTQGGVTTTDYRTAAACEKARAAVVQEQQRRVSQAKQQQGEGAIITDYGPMPQAFCIPG